MGGADTVIRICNVADNVNVEEFDINELNIVTSTFSYLGLMLSLSMLWLCYSFFKNRVQFGGDNSKLQFAAVGVTLLAVTGVVTIVSGLAKYQGDQLNEVLGDKLSENFSDGYSFCWISGLFMIVAALLIVQKCFPG